MRSIFVLSGEKAKEFMNNIPNPEEALEKPFEWEGDVKEGGTIKVVGWINGIAYLGDGKIELTIEPTFIRGRIGDY